MNLDSPKFRDLASLKETESSGVTVRQNVWEISVPSKDSLYWSILLEYMILISPEECDKFIKGIRNELTTAQSTSPSTSKGNSYGILSPEECHKSIEDIRDEVIIISPEEYDLFSNGHRNELTTAQSTSPSKGKSYRTLSPEECHKSIGYIRNELATKQSTSLFTSNYFNIEQEKRKLKLFNPFKNSNYYFQHCGILEAFKLNLNRCASRIRTKTDTLNDDTKLQAASFMLDCTIHVYLLDGIKTKFVSYSPNPTIKRKTKRKTNLRTITQNPKPNRLIITIFQYLKRSLGCPTEHTNIFSFAMTVEHAKQLRKDALCYFLKMANFCPAEINLYLPVMKIEENGKKFLSNILRSSYFHILPRLYKSPYCTLKISQAGYKTNPVDTQPNELSAFAYAAAKENTIYIRILYDYAANCRYLFDRTVRNPDNIILESLKILQNIFTIDKSIIERRHDFKLKMEERILNIINQYSHFNVYQQNIATLILNLKIKLHSAPSDMPNIHKVLIQEMLSFYVAYFNFDLPHSDILKLIDDYLKYSEYYENIDTFTCLSFFDYAYSLRKIFQLKYEDIFADTESSFFLLIVGIRHFLRIQSDDPDESIPLIPFFYRESLKREISMLLVKLNEYIKCDQDKSNTIKKECLNKCLSSFPEIVDTLLISRNWEYLLATSDLKYKEISNKGTLVAFCPRPLLIERALQVLGESLKPQTIPGCVVSCLLASRLPIKLVRELINLRNEFSHFRNNSAHRRLKMEKDSEFFKDLQLELYAILDIFRIVDCTQTLRFETFLINRAQDNVTQQLKDSDILVEFQDACQRRLKKRINVCDKNEQCIRLSVDSINYLIQYINHNNLTQVENISEYDATKVTDILDSIQYVFKLLNRERSERSEIFFQSRLKEVQNYSKQYRNDKNLEHLLQSMANFQKKYSYDIHENFFIEHTHSSDDQFPTLTKFFKLLKQNEITTNDVNEIITEAKAAFIEAEAAKTELEEYIKNKCNKPNEEATLLDKLLISRARFTKLKMYLTSGEYKLALNELNKKFIKNKTTEEKWIPIEQKIRSIFENNDSPDEIMKALLIKIVYKNILDTDIYPSAKLSDVLNEKLTILFSNKIIFLLNRMEIMKSILIEEDDEIKNAWSAERNTDMKHHLTFLMRQRFRKSMSVRGQLEMAFFDCLNILSNSKFSEIYDKVNNLFSGMNLRNYLSHGSYVLDTIGGLLDKDDLPSELINKILELIDDSEAIKTMKELIPKSNSLYMDTVKEWITNNPCPSLDNKIKIITSCERWEKYLTLFPLI